jgi:hypothetical protein
MPPAPGKERHWRASGGREKKKIEEEKKVEIIIKKLELEDVKASEGDLIKVINPFL